MAAAPFLLIAAVALLISPATSQTCKSQTLSHSNTNFTDCTDLSTLKAQLHWAYDPSAKPNPTLTIAYIAPPAKPDGWVAWALNPTGPGMVGAQALVAFKDTNDSIVVKTYNISSYGPISESRISYGVLHKRAEYSGGVMRIFATVALPHGETVLNQVWQVGAAVKDGVPVKHNFAAENLNSKGTLRLGSKAAAGNSSVAFVPAPSPAPEAVPSRGNDRAGGWRIGCSGMGLYGFLVLLGVVLGI